MTDAAAARRRDVFTGVTELVYRCLIAEAAFLVAAAPGFVGIIMLERTPSNIPLYALCALPVLLAFAATIVALAPADDGTLTAWRRFWTTWWRNLPDLLRLLVPALVAAAVLGLNVAFGPAAGIPPVFTVASVVLLVALAAWVVLAIVIANRFDFRTRDVARLAVSFLGARPLSTFGVLALLVLAAAVIGFGSDWVLALLGVFFAAFAAVVTRPVVDDVRERFTATG